LTECLHPYTPDLKPRLAIKLEDFLASYSEALARYQWCLTDPEGYIDHRFGIVQTKLAGLLTANSAEATTTILIPTYKPGPLLFWVLDQISQQKLSQPADRLLVVIYHNGSAQGSRMTSEVLELSGSTSLQIMDEPQKQGVHGGLSHGLFQAHQSGLFNHQVIAHMDDDTGPISPRWLQHTLDQFAQYPNLGALYFAILYGGRKDQMMALNAYKAVTLTAQVVYRLIGSPHSTDGIAAYRPEALMRGSFWAGAVDFNSINGDTHRDGVIRAGYSISQAIDAWSVALADPIRIQEKVGLLRHLLNMAGMQFGTTRSWARKSWRNMYTDGE